MKSEEMIMTPSMEEKALETCVDHQIPHADEPDERFVRKIVHKVDRRLVSLTGLLFAISLLDRASVANANIAGYGSPLFPSHPTEPISDWIAPKTEQRFGTHCGNSICKKHCCLWLYPI